MRTTLLLFTLLLAFLPVPALAATPSVSLGQSFAVALKQDGTAVAWGDNITGQLGDGTTIDRSSPVPVSGLTNIDAIGTGNFHSLAILKDGTLWAWGWNSNGQLGDGTTTNRSTPVKVSGMTNIVAVAAGNEFTLALRSDGTVWAWGGNSFGQLGDGTTTTRTKPTQVVGLTGVVAISARVHSSLALKSDGTAWAWGANDRGQVGDGTLTNRSAPVRVSGLTGVRSISAGGVHSLALKSDGSLWGWGDDTYGQLGDGALVLRYLTPYHASAVTNVATISAGYFYTVLLKNDGTVVTAGGNFNHVLGIPAGFADPLIPVKVAGLVDVAVATAGESNTVVIKKDGTVMAWGLAGGNGDGTAANQLTPVAVHGAGGAGTLAIGPSAPVQIIAPVNIISSGVLGGEYVSVTATASFPPQYVGTPIFLFAYAPAALVHAIEAPKDGPACVLAQITPTGFQPVQSASNLSSFGTNVINAATQSITMIRSVLISQVAGSTLCIGVGNNGTQATAAGQYVCPASVLDASGAACQPEQTTTTLTGGGASTKTLGSRATVSPTVTHYGGFELKNTATVYLLIRGNSLGTLGVTQSYLDAPRVRLYNSQGQDLLFDSNGPGFNGCSGNAIAQGAVVSYYTSVRGQPPNARDACVAQNLPAGAYTFSVTPSSTGVTSHPSAGEILFEVTLGAGSGSIAKTLGSRVTVSQAATLYGGFEIVGNSTVYILVRGNSLSTLGVTQNYLDAPRVRLYDSQGHDLITDGVGPGFNGCFAGANSGTAVIDYYTSVRHQAPHQRDACTARSFSTGAYTFSVTPSSIATISSPGSGEVLFEVTLQ